MPGESVADADMPAGITASRPCAWTTAGAASVVSANAYAMERANDEGERKWAERDIVNLGAKGSDALGGGAVAGMSSLM